MARPNQSRPRKLTGASQEDGKKQQLLFEPRSEWHTVELPDIQIPNDAKAVSTKLIDTIHDFAKHVLDSETADYASVHLQSSSSHKFMSTIMTSGTWNDKVSALTLAVQESPLHTTTQLESLLSMAGKQSRTQAIMALAALKDLFAQGALLPGNRKLRLFSKQPGLLAALQGVSAKWTSADILPNGLESRHLALWAFEHRLKDLYFEVLKILEKWCNDEVEYSRNRAITFIWELLKEKPEQEENLLRLLVNKLGDKSRKVASRASYLTLQLEVTHPAMKLVIINAIESNILLRSNQSQHAKYYAIVTLNQTILKTDTAEVANKLLDIYFSLFVAILNKSKEQSMVLKKRKRSQTAQPVKSEIIDQELEDKSIAQILTGINRAFPFSQKDSLNIDKHLDTIFRITHSANFNTSVQALTLIQQISSVHSVSLDRYMRTLYESLLDPRLTHSSKHTMYLNLLYRSLKDDPLVKRVQAFVKRLLQILSLHEPPFITGVLFLITELTKAYPSLKSMLDQPESLEEDEVEVFRDVDDTEAISTATPKIDPASTYDPRKRDPQHSNADRTCLWELLPWIKHYHPSVNIFVNSICSPDSPYPPRPDPSTHTLIHFLERFVYKNPKQTKSAAISATSEDDGVHGARLRGTSIMQPALASTNTTDHLLNNGGSVNAPNLNSEKFWKQAVETVAPEEVFFHKYFTALGQRQASRLKKQEKKEKRRERKEGDGDDVDSDGFGAEEDEVGNEDEIWSAMVGSQPGLESGDDDSIDGDDDDDLGSGFGTDDDDDVDDVDGGVDIDVEDEDADADADEAFAKAMNAGDDDDEEEEEDDEDDDVETDIDSVMEDDTSMTVETTDGLAKEAGNRSLGGRVVAVQTSKGGEVTAGNEDDDNIDKKQRRKKRRDRMRDLPTFASMDEYAALIDRDADEGLDD